MSKRTTLRVEFEIIAESFLFGEILKFVTDARDHLYTTGTLQNRCNIDVRKVEVIEVNDV